MLNAIVDASLRYKVLVLVGFGWTRHGPWWPATMSSRLFFGLAVGMIGGGVVGLL